MLTRKDLQKELNDALSNLQDFDIIDDDCDTQLLQEKEYQQGFTDAIQYLFNTYYNK